AFRRTEGAARRAQTGPQPHREIARPDRSTQRRLKSVAASTPDKQPVRVTILSQSYTLLTAGDPREVEELARGVDELMLSIAAKSPNADSTRIAVLACLHLADRLHNLEEDLSRLKERVERKSEEFADLLEQVLAGGQ